MSELFTYGSVGGAGYNLGAMAPGEGPLLPGRNRRVRGAYLWTPVLRCRNPGGTRCLDERFQRDGTPFIPGHSSIGR